MITDLHDEESDFTGRARIRNAALELFGRDGAERTSLRAVADLAGVSAPNVIHHFGSKECLVGEVSKYVITRVVAATHSVDASGLSPDVVAQRRTSSLDELFVKEPAVATYLSRLLLDQSAPGIELFLELYDRTIRDLDFMRSHGQIRELEDPPVAAAMILIWALVPVIFSALIQSATGIDTGDAAHLQRWRRAEIDALRNGIYPPPEEHHG